MALSAARTTTMTRFALCVLLLLAHLGHAASLLGVAGRLYNYPFPQTHSNCSLQLRLVNKLPFVAPVEADVDADGDVMLFRGDSPQPEACWHCAPGTSPQPALAGRANRLIRRVANHKNAVFRQFPWHVTLVDENEEDKQQRKQRPSYDFYCSGALVSEEWVLTAATCVQGRDAVSLRLGSYTPSRVPRERCSRLVTVRSSHIAVHPNFTETTSTASSSHDIAAVRLDAPVNFTRYLLPARLPSTDSFLTTFAGRDSWVSGWAVARGAGGVLRLRSILGFAHEKVLSNEECSRTYGPRISQSHLCASTARFAEGCGGDAGAPLVVAAEDAKDSFVLVGVLSFASGRCSSGRPAAFTRISAHLRWIQNTTGIRPRLPTDRDST